MDLTIPDRKVIAFELVGDGQWKKIGFGYAIVKATWAQNEGVIQFVSLSHELVWEFIIHRDVSYKKENTMIMSWTEPDGRDIALSFETARECGEYWSFINDVQARLLEPSLGWLPPPRRENLPQIYESLLTLKALDRPRILRTLKIGYIENILQMFPKIEKEGSVNEMQTLCGIIKKIISESMRIRARIREMSVTAIVIPPAAFQDTEIVEKLMSEEFVGLFVSCLEYDPESPISPSNIHRDMIISMKPVEVVPVESEVLRSLTLRNQRSHYIRDSVLVRTPNDPLVAILGALINSANEQILYELLQEQNFFEELFKCFEPGVDEKKREDAVKALRQIFRMAQGSSARISLSREMLRHNLHMAFRHVLAHPSPQIRLMGLEIIELFCRLEPTVARSACLMERALDKELKSYSLTSLELVIERLTTDHGDLLVGGKACEVLKFLVDCKSLNQKRDGVDLPEIDDDERAIYDNFVGYFYASLLGKVIGPIKRITSKNVPLHTIRTKAYLTNADIGNKAILLLESGSTPLRVAALRFIRKCLSTKNTAYLQYFAQNKLIPRIVAVLLTPEHSSNALNSACQELITFVCKIRLDEFLDSTWQTCADQLKEAGFERTSEIMDMMYRSHNSESIHMSNESDDQQTPQQARPGAWVSTTVDRDEEAYFFNDSDDDSEEESEPARKKIARRLEDEDEDGE
ncbi:11251_t:CDS:10 [Paraglomus brasilianum]|uniref:11251_t:CDS:1 n=1 Tax=Paraglomus brasilianum TaxID=144538 RepID=A0A9N9GDZ2_9GLOM|nr:11251_t:CDS:10 [Paraglomus brasilianum]